MGIRTKFFPNQGPGAGSWERVLAVLCALPLIQACALQQEQEEDTGDAEATYAWINANVIQPKCAQCHTAGGSGPGDFRTYSSLMATGTVVAGNPDASSFYTRTSSGSMPQNAPMLSSSTLTAIRTWIENGALEAAAATSSSSSSAASSSSASLSVISIAPASGTGSGGTSVTVTGTGIQASATVALGESSCASPVVTPPTTISCTTQAKLAGVVNVVVTNPDTGTAQLTNGFTFTSSFSSVRQFIIQPKCQSCHGGAGPGPHDFRTYTPLMASGVVTSGNAGASLFYTRVSSDSMPPGSPLSTQEKQAIADWINGGAPDD